MERYGTQRTAHIWVHFIKRRDLDKYFNNWRVECRHCRDAYDARTSTQEIVSLPEILISTTPKMMSHLRSCVYARRVLGNNLPSSPVRLEVPKRGAASKDREGSPSRAKKRCRTKSAPPHPPSLRPTLLHSTDFKHEGNDDKDSTPPTTITYSTAYIWEHYIKRTDLAKTHNNWYVDCKHCRRAAETTVPLSSPPPVFASVMTRMKAHLFKCAHIPPEDLATFQKTDAAMAPYQPKRRPKNAVESPRQVHVIVLPPSAVPATSRLQSDDSKHFHHALPADNQPDDVAPTIAVTWLTEKERALYAASTEGFIHTAAILGRVNLAHFAHSGLYSVPNTSMQQIQALVEQQVDMPDEATTTKLKSDIPEEPVGSSHSTAQSLASTSSAAHNDGGPATLDTEGLLVEDKLLPHFTTVFRKDSDVAVGQVVCTLCRKAHESAPDLVAAPLAIRATPCNLSRHLDSCDLFQRASAQEMRPVAALVYRAVPWPRVLWKHFIQRVDLPRFLSPWQMRHHVRTCPRISNDKEERADGVVMSAALPSRKAIPLEHGAETPDDTRGGVVALPTSADPVVYAAMEYAAVRWDGGFQLAQLGYDVTDRMMREDERDGHGKVEVTWLHKESDAVVYAFGHDQVIPVDWIVCSVELVHFDAPHRFTLPPEQLQKVHHNLRSTGAGTTTCT
ncbi:hypothetical protein, variant 1 [Aphanomyces invadans]|uniref:BED-type domain-containing protein n=1 Tax=Aphanomyces invadans TaxID=157072 RepID=A0A024TK85_9STRA|nr:hypothetical protein, variant 1 [Aphanomyces invadans]ETV94570.1 hypothetical protein, variant 1 [Aphanomyces invadans]|eukprot:XP_008876887.1 hypothetical protein, variant 1 [Aphanomyces invadans]